jgi:hypothetical protein
MSPGVGRSTPRSPAASAAFGRIAARSRTVFTGFPGAGRARHGRRSRYPGARVGGFTADDGSYELPGLTPGSWLVAIEPLDGDPAGTEPFRVNLVVAGTLDTNFPEEFHDDDEGAVEADPTAANGGSRDGGDTGEGIDVVTTH